MKHLDSTLKGKAVHKGLTYDDKCKLEWENLYDNLDHYYLMHLAGWFVAALIIRDTFVVHFWSILDEILGKISARFWINNAFVELSWQHIYPHFREYWRDHVLVNLLMSNTPAIYLGNPLVDLFGLQYFKSSQYVSLLFIVIFTTNLSSNRNERLDWENLTGLEEKVRKA